MRRVQKVSGVSGMRGYETLGCQRIPGFWFSLGEYKALNRRACLPMNDMERSG